MRNFLGFSLCYILFAPLFLVGCSTAPKEAKHSFGEERKIGSSNSPSLAEINGKLVVVSHSSEPFRSADTPEPHIFVRESDDQGETWTKSGTLKTPLSYGIWGSDLAAVGDRLFYAWTANVGTSKTILASYSKEGSEWSEPVKVASSRANNLSEPMIVGEGRTVFAAWLDRAMNSNSVKAAISKDGGATWSKSQALFESEKTGRGNNKGGGQSVLLLMDQKGTAHAFLPGLFKDESGKLKGTILHCWSSGGSWESDTVPTLGPVHSMTGGVSESGRIRLVFIGMSSQSLGNPTAISGPLATMHSDDQGKTWSQVKPIDAEETLKRGSKVARSGKNWMVVWQDGGHLLSSVSEDDGSTWSKSVQVAEDLPKGSHFDFWLSADSVTVVRSEVVKGKGDRLLVTKGKLR